ncbi:MAG: glycerol-3-phosphate dehydrogenase, partial [Paracoccus denitrificans]
LEFLEFRLVAEALAEREVLLRMMPHIAHPMRFVMPLDEKMRFDTETPVSRMAKWVMPWSAGHRPDIMIRAGLFLYDHIGKRKFLPPTKKLDLRRAPEGRPIRTDITKAFEYSDVWVNDARLVALNARDAAERGASILTQTRVTDARRDGDLWRVTTTQGVFHARAFVNAGGPWVADVIHDVTHLPTRERIRLVRGSHIVTRKLFDHDKAYFFQGPDGRIIFSIPYENDFTLIGTTDVDHSGPPGAAECSPEEQAYLCKFANRYFRQAIAPADVVWTFSGVRPLYDDGASSATAATRDYVLSMDTNGPACLNVFGGKITTYRRLAESAMDKLSQAFPDMGPAWTAGAPLPGGDFPVAGVPNLIADLRAAYPFLTQDWATRLIRAYGTDAAKMLGEARQPGDLGRDFGATLTEVEIDWLTTHEFARTAQDILWRRSKLGLHITPAERDDVTAWMEEKGRRDG